ncbi:ABC transporter ATP-binding protein [Robbsia sp. KACC 23696]|uniref:ABC transporter ATP-binding protein n=1 Tax=Robbsia sp. KACC 23696 TaxID=3149231 RepID=UPI00325AB508
MQVSYALSLRGVSKAWPSKEGGDPHPVLRGIDLDVVRGQFVALLGPSGCGKSTLLRLIAGLDHPDAGHILIDGRNANGLGPSERQLSMVFQSYALFPHLSVEENVAFGLRVRRVPRGERRERVAAALTATGLLGFEKRKPAALSGGQRQRVALARAIVADHPLCLMDEPLSNLDAKLRHAVRLEIRELQQRLGMTVLYVTHDQSEAMGMADRIVLMQAGRIEQDGPATALYHRPASAFVAGFIGSPPMVLLPEATLPCAQRPWLDARVDPRTEQGMKVRVGIRPEHIEITRASERVLAATVSAIEFQGAESYIYLKTPDGQPIVVRAAPRVMQAMPMVGDLVGLDWRQNACHVFDAASGKRLEAFDQPRVGLTVPRHTLPVATDTDALPDGSRTPFIVPTSPTIQQDEGRVDFRQADSHTHTIV